MRCIPTLHEQWTPVISIKLLRNAILALLSFNIASSALGADTIIPSASHKEPLYVQFQLAFSSDTDFHDSVAHFDFERSQEGSFVSAISVGRKIADRFLVWPFEVVAYASAQKLDERGYQADAWGFSVYAKAYHSFEIPYADIPVRLGFGQGLSYVSRVPLSESRDFHPHSSEKLLCYLDYSLQIPLRNLTSQQPRFFGKSMQEVYVGYTIWHRSTLFGLFGESSAGINYLGVSIESKLR